MRRIGVAIVLCLASTRAAAQPLGGEFRVNTYTTNKQYLPAVASDSAGNFVIVWQSYFQDGDGWGVYAQRYTSTGAKLGGEFQVNTTTTGPQRYPRVAYSSGFFVIVWSGNNYGQAFGQRFASSGEPLGGEFRVNTSGGVRYPDVAAAGSTGDFVVVWQNADGTQVLGQRFNSGGAPAGANFGVNAVTNNCGFAKVASASTGNFVVVFVETGLDGDASGVFGQRFASTGAPLGSEFGINTFTTGVQTRPFVASDASGNFVVAWYDESQAGRNIARRFSSTGAPLTDEFRVDDSVHYLQQASVSSDAAGNFVVAFGVADADGLGVAARLFDSSGAPTTTAFPLNTYTSNQQAYATVAYASGGGAFVATWGSHGVDGTPSETGISARRFATTKGCLVGDVNWDGSVDVADVFYMINSLFAGGPPPLCSGDVNASGTVDVSDVFYLINFLFAGGPAPV